MARKRLSQIVSERPFTDFADWWPIGQEFLAFMAEAIVSQWANLSGNNGDLGVIKSYVAEYLNIVYNKEARPSLVEVFATKSPSSPVQSGEFDALSYAFFRSAFELIEQHLEAYEQPLNREKRLFTKRVGRIFFHLVDHHLHLDLPNELQNEQSFTRLKDSIQKVGTFLKAQGYLRDRFAFFFTLDVEYKDGRIRQTEAEFITNLSRQGKAHALYEMGYPIILPSAVYLYHTMGEAQHHSSRTIEELFQRVGYEARETDDFDPTGYPPDRVVELWEIRKVGEG